MSVTSFIYNTVEDGAITFICIIFHGYSSNCLQFAHIGALF